MGELTELLQPTCLEISLLSYAAVLAVVAITCVAKQLFAQICTQIIRPMATQTRSGFADRFRGCARKPGGALGFLIGLEFALLACALVLHYVDRDAPWPATILRLRKESLRCARS